MNERFKELMTQAGFDPAAIERMGVMPQAEKFAELIVMECANFVENIFDDDGGHAPCEDYAKGIKQHFGVEE